MINQSVENAGVAFVKKAHERNEFSEKKKWRTSADEQGKGLKIYGTNWFEDELRQVTKGWCAIAPIERYSSYRYFQWKKSVAIIYAVILVSFIRFC